MDPAERFVTDFVGALADVGLRHAAISPGSRNTPLSLAFLAEPRITTHTVLDERSGGFFALGAAKASWLPTAVVCTSGTAAANYHPAVIEADSSRTPLLVLTADRPPELRGTGANQTIDQLGLYGNAVRLFHDAGVPDEATAASAASLALRAWVAAAEVPAGPVHLNFPFREPFSIPSQPAGPTGLRHVPGYRSLSPEGLAELAGHLSGTRALIVAGGRPRPGFASATAMLAASAGIPVVADIQCRFPSPASIAYGDLLAAAGVFDRLQPDVILRIGAVPTSKAVWTWMAGTSAAQLYLDDGSWGDALGTAETAFRGDPASVMADLGAMIEPAPDGWLQAWRDADETALKAFHDALDASEKPNEPVTARALYQVAPAGTIIYAGSSMPIRDLDSFAGPLRGDVTVIANRGASGVDGLLSAAAGAAAAEGQRVAALVGDIAAIHDANALELIARESLPVTAVVVNNDGGGIFSFLPQAAAVDEARFSAAFATPHGRSLAAVAEAFGVPARPADNPADLTDAMAGDGPALVEVRTDRDRNVALHAELREAVSAAFG